MEAAPDEVLASARITEAVDSGRGEWSDTLRALYGVTIEHFGGRTTAELDPEQSFDPQTRTAMDWVEKYGLSRSTLIAETSKDEARQVLRDGLAEGKSIPQIAKGIERHYEERGKQRSRVAAITEIVSSSNFGAITAARQSGVAVSKQWMDAGDQRVRFSHEQADGQTVPLGEPFIVSGFELDFPGDPSLGIPPDLVIGCRCSLAFNIS